MKKIFLILCISAPLISEEIKTVEAVFNENNHNQIFLDIEAALARAQASQGIIPEWAAKEITNKADTRYMTVKDVADENAIVRHSVVARLNVWRRSIEDGADEFVHFGTTTVDINDTLLVLQIKQSIELFIEDMLTIEKYLLKLTKDNINTVMTGRTLGQHALPITFGKKTSTWLAENRRNIERLEHVRSKIDKSGILKGAVGSYLGLGKQAMETETLMMKELGLSQPYFDDWHGTRDVFAEYALTLALISKSYGRIGNELTLLQMTDIAETQEVLGSGAVGSSTMPHKKNPRGPGQLIEYSRIIPRLSEIILDDMINDFERDGQKSDDEIKLISITMEEMLNRAKPIIRELKVNKDVMKANLKRTQGLMLSQRIVFALADDVGKSSANDLMHEVAVMALNNHISLKEAIMNDERVMQYFSEKELDELLNPETYIGLAEEQTQKIIKDIERKRKAT